MLAKCDYGYCGVQMDYTDGEDEDSRKCMQHKCPFQRGHICNTVKTSKVAKYLRLLALSLRALWINEQKEGPLLHKWKLSQ